MQTVIPRSEFPRPDFVREDWVCLNGQWLFSFDKPVFDRMITVPFCYQSVKSGIGEIEEHDVVWYRRYFPVDMDRIKGGRLLLKFGAVDSEADVWVNGQYVGSHSGGYTPFSFDITDLVRSGENEVTVCARDTSNTDKPRGKQTWTGKTFGCWYTPITGIWQSVWIEYAGKAWLKRIKCTPDVARLEALCELFVESEGTLRAEVRASIRGWELCCQTVWCDRGYGKVVLAFPDYDLCRGELLWTPESPNLVDVTVTLFPEGGKKDQVMAYFGMRSIERRGMNVALNGTVLYQRLILDQGYWPDSLLTPPDDDAICRDIELTKAMGFNGARKHQKIEDPRYYYWADKLGLIVWGELPSAYLFNDNAIRASGETLHEFLERDFNHPCIVTWVPVNESWGVRNVLVNRQQQDYCRMLTYHLKAMDQTRLVSSNDGWEQVTETDICAIHDYALLPNATEKYEKLSKVLESYAEHRFIFAEGNQWKGQPVLVTEYGGIAFIQDDEEGSWGYYGRVKDSDDFFGRLIPVTEYLLRSGHFAGFCYTQLTDVMQEVNGLLTQDRHPKVPLEALRKVFGG